MPQMFLSMLASTFSIFPVMIACTIKRRDPSNSTNRKRRPTWLGIAILTLMWILSVTEAFLSLYGNLDYEFHEELEHEEIEGESGDSYYAWAICDRRHSAHYWVGMKAAQYLLLTCPIFLVLVTVFLITGFGYPGVVDKPLVAHCRHVWRLIVAWICLLSMWGILGFFTWLRHNIDATVGHLNESNESVSFSMSLRLAVLVLFPAVPTCLRIAGLPVNLTSAPLITDQVALRPVVGSFHLDSFRTSRSHQVDK